MQRLQKTTIPYLKCTKFQLRSTALPFNFDCLILRQLSSPLFQDCSCQVLNSLLTSWPQQDGESSLSTRPSIALECHLSICFTGRWDSLCPAEISQKCHSAPHLNVRGNFKQDQCLKETGCKSASPLTVSPCSAVLHFYIYLKQYFKSIFS